MPMNCEVQRMNKWQLHTSIELTGFFQRLNYTVLSNKTVGIFTKAVTSSAVSNASSLPGFKMHHQGPQSSITHPICFKQMVLAQ